MTLERVSSESSNENPAGSVTLASFEVPSQAGNELQAAEKVAALATQLGLPEQICERIKTAVAETTMNAIEHGNHFRAEIPVLIWVGKRQEKLIIRVSDQGGAYAFPESEIPDLDAKLAGLQSPRGWGLFLVKNMVDEVHQQTDGNLNTVELVLRVGGVSDGFDAI
ncbi:MAG TPA: ATP-binding protein [Anaerolineaceae bacterium]|nr:ATP-binding protein [Anaerolineaceae bacterium]